MPQPSTPPSSATDTPTLDERYGLTPLTPEQYAAYKSSSRLSIPFPLRLPATTALAFTTGFFLGISQGSLTSGLRFRAENAHRFPTNQAGWYLYHKSKNYNMALGGIVEGCKMGGKTGLWVGVFVGMEECVDWGRNAVRGLVVGKDGGMSRDVLSTILAGVGTAGMFSAWHRFPVATTVRTAKMGAKYGLALGVVEDAVSFARGRKLGYVEFLRRHVFGGEDKEGEADAAVG
ncbi:hypothetical protein BAUCODRAFT_63067 [Baudoinia panamericana UAMH 10762]|uniref:Mitochondrial import inner membrane translocase subunit TIM22 n=1 Tax=Baudoinia panamericana (strain UAMH 10762) TaxID=717646 RepID=M2NJ59_BAUPA|nr:uncharacterized protein BAUCODRAFT_63067 [Baudoinia panamericana UAMH 10762]EMC99429.1 hypothetical protein BAUCODRAFT_63067 [Baudoinia panamericana UAMH 10762]